MDRCFLSHFFFPKGSGFNPRGSHYLCPFSQAQEHLESSVKKKKKKLWENLLCWYFRRLFIVVFYCKCVQKCFFSCIRGYASYGTFSKETKQKQNNANKTKQAVYLYICCMKMNKSFLISCLLQHSTVTHFHALSFIYALIGWWLAVCSLYFTFCTELVFWTSLHKTKSCSVRGNILVVRGKPSLRPCRYERAQKSQCLKLQWLDMGKTRWIV